MRLNILGSKRKLPKRRNFNFDASNGFDGIYFQSHYIRILPVKIPRYSNGNITDYDIYDFLQGEKTEKNKLTELIPYESPLLLKMTELL